MTERFNKLSNAEDERLSVLLQNLGEAITAIGKIKRHGYESCHPNGGQTNREFLIRGLGDVRNAITMMIHARDLSNVEINIRAVAKSDTIAPFLHHQGEHS